MSTTRLLSSSVRICIGIILGASQLQIGFANGDVKALIDKPDLHPLSLNSNLSRDEFRNQFLRFAQDYPDLFLQTNLADYFTESFIRPIMTNHTYYFNKTSPIEVHEEVTDQLKNAEFLRDWINTRGSPLLRETFNIRYGIFAFYAYEILRPYDNEGARIFSNNLKDNHIFFTGGKLQTVTKKHLENLSFLFLNIEIGSGDSTWNRFNRLPYFIESDINFDRPNTLNQILKVVFKQTLKPENIEPAFFIFKRVLTFHRLNDRKVFSEALKSLIDYFNLTKTKNDFNPQSLSNLSLILTMIHKHGVDQSSYPTVIRDVYEKLGVYREFGDILPGHFERPLTLIPSPPEAGGKYSGIPDSVEVARMALLNAEMAYLSAEFDKMIQNLDKKRETLGNTNLIEFLNRRFNGFMSLIKKSYPALFHMREENSSKLFLLSQKIDLILNSTHHQADKERLIKIRNSLSVVLNDLEFYTQEGKNQIQACLKSMDTPN